MPRKTVHALNHFSVGPKKGRGGSMVVVVVEVVVVLVMEGEDDGLWGLDERASTAQSQERKKV